LCGKGQLPGILKATRPNTLRDHVPNSGTNRLISEDGSRGELCHDRTRCL
jgi:hypothetical protein